MSCQPTSSNSSTPWLDYKHAKKELIESHWFRNNYEFYKREELKNFLEIINYPYDITYIKKLYHAPNPISSIFMENHKFLKNVGEINDVISIENPTKIIDLIKESDYALKYSCYMYHLYYISMTNKFTTEEEILKHRIVTIYYWYEKDYLPTSRNFSITYGLMKNYKRRYCTRDFETEIICLMERTYSSNVTDILITNFINGKLIDKHNYTSMVELKRNLFHFIFIEIIQRIRRNSNTQYKENYTLSKPFYDYLEEKFYFNVDSDYKNWLGTNYDYFEGLMRIKVKIIEKIKDA